MEWSGRRRRRPLSTQPKGSGSREVTVMSPLWLYVCSGTIKKERAITRLKGVITPGIFGKGKKSIELETVVS
jgi:hypothetical protein